MTKLYPALTIESLRTTYGYDLHCETLKNDITRGKFQLFLQQIADEQANGDLKHVYATLKRRMKRASEDPWDAELSREILGFLAGTSIAAKLRKRMQEIPYAKSAYGNDFSFYEADCMYKARNKGALILYKYELKGWYEYVTADLSHDEVLEARIFCTQLSHAYNAIEFANDYIKQLAD